jgi:uncharacterized membrane protein YfcA
MSDVTADVREIKLQAKKDLIWKIIPWSIIGGSASIALVIHDFGKPTNQKFGVFFCILVGYFIFCLPWVYGMIRTRINEAAQDYQRNNNRHRFGLDATDFLISAKTMFFSLILALTLLFKVPYKVIKTIYIVNKKNTVEK